MITDALSNTRVRKKAISAEVSPSPSAVKKAELKKVPPDKKTSWGKRETV